MGKKTVNVGKKTVDVGKKTFDEGTNTIDVGKKRQEKRQAPSRRDGLCSLGCQGRLSLADSTARALIERRTRSGP